MNDFVMNGKAQGLIANRLMRSGWDTNCLRPYTAEDGKDYITRMVNNKAEAVPIGNATATLRKDEWIWFDNAMLDVARTFLGAEIDLRRFSSTLTIPNGMGSTVLQYQNNSDINPATISMDGRRVGESDRPVYDLANLPLPLIHKDFSFSAREIETSRKTGVPLDTTMITMATEKVLELSEALVIGNAASYSYGGGTVYGYINFPGRITYTITAPTAGGWTPAVFVTQLLAMIQLAVDQFHRGPFVLYLGAGWGPYLEIDYSGAKGDNTLLDRITKLRRIAKVEILDNLSGFQAVLVETKPRTARMVDFLPLTIIQWETEGGMDLHWKVLTGRVPQLREDQNGNCGIVHGTV